MNSFSFAGTGTRGPARRPESGLNNMGAGTHIRGGFEICGMDAIAQQANEGGGIFGEKARGNFEPFAAQAWLLYAFWAAARVLAFSGIAILLLFALDMLFGFNLLPLLFALPLILVAGVWYSTEYVRRFIFALDKKNLFIRRGVLLFNYTLTPYENIQDVQVNQSIVDRILGLWSVTVLTATVGGGATRVPFLSREGAGRVKDAIFARIKEARHVTD